MTQKIYPLNPIHETTTRDGRRAWVAFYAPNTRGNDGWVGATEDCMSILWTTDGNWLRSETSDLDLTTIPEIPAEAREPKPGEVWEVGGARSPALIVSVWPNCVTALNCFQSKTTIGYSALARPWPADKHHGFEGLIEAILAAHGGKP